MSDLQKLGPDWGSLGSFKPFTAGISGQQRVSDSHGRYLQATLENRAFYMSVSGATPTAYTGAGAGTPLLAIHNPANSGMLLAVLFAGFINRAAASAAGVVGANLWAGPSVTPTGTKTSPTNALSQLPSGSAALGFSNTALTGSTALALVLPLTFYYWATAAGAISAPGLFDVGSMVVAAPGNQIAFGATAALTSATWDAALYWEEMPYQVLG